MTIGLPEGVNLIEVATLVLAFVSACAALWAALSGHRQARLLARQMGRAGLTVSSAWDTHRQWDDWEVLNLYFGNPNDTRMEIVHIQVVKPRAAMIGPAGPIETDGMGGRMPPRHSAPVGQRRIAPDVVLRQRSEAYYRLAVKGRPAGEKPMTLRVGYRFSDQRSRLNSITITT